MSGSYVLPSQDGTAGDAALIGIIQGAVTGLTGLDPTLVRPRWQPQPPTQPSPTTDWCAIGVTTYTGFDYPQATQDDAATWTQHRYERLDVLATFYGPNSGANATLLRDGIYLAQNALVLSQQGVKVRGADAIVHLGEEINSQFIQRADLPLSFVRMVERSYNTITAIGQVSVDFVTDTGLTCTITAAPA